MMGNKRHKISCFLLLAGIIAVAAALRFRDLDAAEIMWDELMDVRTALSYCRNPNPFDFNDLDPLRHMQVSQARLPFYLTALGLSFFPRSEAALSYKTFFTDVCRARGISVLFGIFTVLVVYFLGKELYGVKTGIFSAFLLAISSYHIGFSRFAVTHGSSYDPVFFLLSLLLFFRGVARRNQKYLLAAGITTGLACAAKFSAVLLLPGLFLFLAIAFRREMSWEKIKYADKRLWRLLQLNLVALFLFMWIAVYNCKQQIDSGWILIFFLAVVCVYLVLFLKMLFAIERCLKTGAIALIYINIVLTSAVFMFIGSPIHLNPGNIFCLLSWLPQFLRGWYTGPAELFGVQPATVLFFKLGLPFSVLFLLGFCYNSVNLNKKENLFTGILFVLYFAVVASLKDFMSWYLMPILPLAIIISAGFIVRCGESYKTGILRIVLAVAILSGIVFQFFSLKAIFPYYHLDGYKLGARFIGYNKPCFLFVDGFRDSVDWLEQNISGNVRVGIVYNIRYLEAARFDVIFQTLAALYSSNKNIKYEYADKQAGPAGYDYLIVSAFFGGDWIGENDEFNLVHRVRLSGLEAFGIYKNTRKKI